MITPAHVAIFVKEGKWVFSKGVHVVGLPEDNSNLRGLAYYRMLEVQCVGVVVVDFCPTYVVLWRWVGGI